MPSGPPPANARPVHSKTSIKVLRYLCNGAIGPFSPFSSARPHRIHAFRCSIEVSRCDRACRQISRSLPACCQALVSHLSACIETPHRNEVSALVTPTAHAATIAAEPVPRGCTDCEIVRGNAWRTPAAASYMRILVVEDDSLLAAGLVRTLTRAAHAVDRAATGIQADAALANQAYDLVVLDIGLPGMDGFEVLRRLRSRDSTTSVLVLTARDAVEDRVHGLDMGADDYLTKPFSLTELEARVRVLLRRAMLPTLRLSVGRLTVDVAAKRIKIDDALVELTVREWALLELFLSRPGHVLSKEQIAQHLFAHDDQVAPNTIEVYVSRLRAKIEPAGVKIRTIRGFGYLWETETAD